MRWLLVFLLLVCSVNAQESEYAKLLERAKRGDPNLDFVALRVAYVATPEYCGYFTPDVSALYSAMRSSDWSAVEKEGNALLEACYLDLDAHYGLMVMAEETNNAAAQAQHDYMLTGLSKSIRNGHDGSSPDQAYAILSVGEEYAVCRVAGWKVQEQGLAAKDGRRYDVLTVIDLDGRKFDVFFDITSFFGKFSSVGFHGGYSSYFTEPDGHLWEATWNRELLPED